MLKAKTSGCSTTWSHTTTLPGMTRVREWLQAAGCSSDWSYGVSATITSAQSLTVRGWVIEAIGIVHWLLSARWITCCSAARSWKCTARPISLQQTRFLLFIDSRTILGGRELNSAPFQLILLSMFEWFILKDRRNVNRPNVRNLITVFVSLVILFRQVDHFCNISVSEG